jgi:hypothetical protein
LFLGWLHEAEMSYGSKKNDKEGKQTEQPALTDDSATNVCFGNHQETSAYDVQFYSFFFFSLNNFTASLSARKTSIATSPLETITDSGCN